MTKAWDEKLKFEKAHFYLWELKNRITDRLSVSGNPGFLGIKFIYL